MAPVVVAALSALAVAMLGGLITDLGNWYYGLRQPPWKPPDWLFGPAWTLIFALAAAAGVTAWHAIESRAQRQWLLVLFALNGFLNVLWSLMFFRLQRPDWAQFEVAFLWLSIAVLIAFVGRHSRRAAWLLMPYLAWVSFAAVVNGAVVSLNAPFGGG
ncbi:MAG TPA: TspO/MBR family protein [Burkholderiaceae bacterium]|nr:TspO/MBR family protein [Burkholderiaceae bacterium]